MAPFIEVVTERVTLGEGPHWDIATQSLFYVDIFGQNIHKYTPATNKHTKGFVGKSQISLISTKTKTNSSFSEGGPLGFAIPVEGTKDHFLVGVGRKLMVVAWDGISEKTNLVEVLVEVENEDGYTGNRFNDAKADPKGRLWAGRKNSVSYVSLLIVVGDLRYHGS